VINSRRLRRVGHRRGRNVGKPEEEKQSGRTRQTKG
jgi:hypothetical protein